MHTRTIQTKYRSETNTGPLRIFHPTIATFVVSGESLYDGLVGGGHLYHFWSICGRKRLGRQVFVCDGGFSCGLCLLAALAVGLEAVGVGLVGPLIWNAKNEVARLKWPVVSNGCVLREHHKR